MELQKIESSQISVGDTIQDIQGDDASIFRVVRIDKLKDDLVLEFIGGYPPIYDKLHDGYYFPLNTKPMWYKKITQ